MSRFLCETWGFSLESFTSSTGLASESHPFYFPLPPAFP